MQPTEHDHLLDQLRHVAAGLGQTLAPFCEVVLHDLLDPEHAVLAIHNNQSGRAVGDPATELGLARIANAGYAQVVANYPNRFPDGRPAKSTSIGIRDSGGRYIAALCLNVDVSLFRSLEALLGQFGRTEGAQVLETLEPSGTEALRRYIDQFAARHNTTPRALKAAERRLLLQELKDAGMTDVRRAMETVAACLGVSRATVYNDAR
ncbi:putative transcriptional regulator YheO [Pseudoduganella flava]|uniref:Transcriptional regulator n=1 Tax=Pseudoduganella flava TaxID=871742 RepID=A0A562PSE8_9BURK|nr:PAS domain-containing protein [Pseudoduganella flava]QGZ39327.1 transcriptional regulator [Pseudoduganella flava]TWI47365.1 putative transcriptional regulator YheO [Pseudoduganella flava]